ncbi:SAM-dependent methyltransferase [Streptomyces griseochromogenes]|uniref:SAM-dependent methyltransferase n=1 Tax=Streptomyces griseochromogenes TaxID=68214 RepID=A0A1B1B2W6_9ACTN|nr:methyltransferase [Streptomyces griseochromogenes]ANP53153.1 hypothetical protein AVL59_29695 [Streptomyces griseochromogenes]MBP2053841.1 SAM-dependent methyltransferase [Streptomyces griseochromogenes]
MTSTDADAVLAKFRDYVTGPTRYANLLTVFELGIVAQLKATGPDGMTATQLAAVTGVSAHHVEQLLELPVKDGFIARAPRTGAYTLDGIARLTDEELARVMPWLHMVKEVCLRQLYHLTESVREGRIVGLEQLYGFTGNFYQASKAHPELHAAWEPVMHAVTGYIDPWFYSRLDLPAGARVIDIAGNTAQGAVLAQKYHGEKGIHVTCFDLPEKEDEALDNIAGAGVGDSCRFIGGDALAEIPKGFDVAMIKHFLDMWDHDNALRILRNTYEALPAGGRLIAMHLTYPEDGNAATADFFPAYFFGCTMAQGGPQKLSTWAAWIEEAGFKITGTVEQDMTTAPADTIPAHSIVYATKV